VAESIRNVDWGLVEWVAVCIRYVYMYNEIDELR